MDEMLKENIPISQKMLIRRLPHPQMVAITLSLKGIICKAYLLQKTHKGSANTGRVFV